MSEYWVEEVPKGILEKRGYLPTWTSLVVTRAQASLEVQQQQGRGINVSIKRDRRECSWFLRMLLGVALFRMLSAFFFFLQEMFIEFRGRQWSFLFNWTYSGVGSCCLVMCWEGCELCLGLGWCILLQGTWVEGGSEVSVVGPFKWRGGSWVAGWTSLWTEIGLVLYLWPHYTKLSDTNPPGLLSAYCRPGPVLSTSMCHFSSQRNLSF